MGRALTEMTTQGRELMYARDILRVIESEAATPLLTGLTERQQSVETLKSEVNKSWLRRLIQDDDQTQMQRVAQEIAAAFDTVRKTRQAVRQLTTPSEPTGGRVQKMYTMIPEQQAVDLKDLVLQMMAQLNDPSQALEVSLDGLADLFGVIRHLGLHRGGILAVVTADHIKKPGQILRIAGKRSDLIQRGGKRHQTIA